MKTEINLSDYVFGAKPKLLKRQISDDPESGFARVIELQRAELLFDVDIIELKALTYFVDAENEKVLTKFTTPTLLEGKPWIIQRGEMTIKLDEEFEPIENPDFDETQEVSTENYPYILVDAYEQFSTILLSPDIDKSLAALYFMFVDSNDEKGLYD